VHRRGITRALAAVAVIVVGAGAVAGVIATSESPLRAYRPDARIAEAPLGVRCGERTIQLATRWSFPAVEPRGLVWLQHGFARSGSRVADLADALAADGLVVVSPTIDAFGDCSLNGATTLLPGITDLLADAPTSGSLLDAALRAAGNAGVSLDRLPDRLALIGHSAGAAAMTQVAGDLVARRSGEADLRILLLLDPVENRAGAMAEHLPSLAGVEVLAITAPPNRCNANASGTGVLALQVAGFIGVRLEGGCHCDAEGDSTNVVCTAVCGESDPEDVATLRALTRAWLAGAVDDTRHDAVYPGGAELERLVEGGRLTLLFGG
jgi:hypothetical protein